MKKIMLIGALLVVGFHHFVTAEVKSLVANDKVSWAAIQKEVGIIKSMHGNKGQVFCFGDYQVKSFEGKKYCYFPNVNCKSTELAPTEYGKIPDVQISESAFMSFKMACSAQSGGKPCGDLEACMAEKIDFGILNKIAEPDGASVGSKPKTESFYPLAPKTNSGSKKGGRSAK